MSDNSQQERRRDKKDKKEGNKNNQKKASRRKKGKKDEEEEKEEKIGGKRVGSNQLFIQQFMKPVKAPKKEEEEGKQRKRLVKQSIKDIMNEYKSSEQSDKSSPESPSEIKLYQEMGELAEFKEKTLLRSQKKYQEKLKKNDGRINKYKDRLHKILKECYNFQLTPEYIEQKIKELQPPLTHITKRKQQMADDGKTVIITQQSVELSHREISVRINAEKRIRTDLMKKVGRISSNLMPHEVEWKKGEFSLQNPNCLLESRLKRGGSSFEKWRKIQSTFANQNRLKECIDKYNKMVQHQKGKILEKARSRVRGRITKQANKIKSSVRGGINQQEQMRDPNLDIPMQSQEREDSPHSEGQDLLPLRDSKRKKQLQVENQRITDSVNQPPLLALPKEVKIEEGEYNFGQIEAHRIFVDVLQRNQPPIHQFMEEQSNDEDNDFERVNRIKEMQQKIKEEEKDEEMKLPYEPFALKPSQNPIKRRISTQSQEFPPQSSTIQTGHFNAMIDQASDEQNQSDLKLSQIKLVIQTLQEMGKKLANLKRFSIHKYPHLTALYGLTKKSIFVDIASASVTPAFLAAMYTDCLSIALFQDEKDVEAAKNSLHTAIKEEQKTDLSGRLFNVQVKQGSFYNYFPSCCDWSGRPKRKLIAPPTHVFILKNVVDQEALKSLARNIASNICRVLVWPINEQMTKSILIPPQELSIEKIFEGTYKTIKNGQLKLYYYCIIPQNAKKYYKQWNSKKAKDLFNKIKQLTVQRNKESSQERISNSEGIMDVHLSRVIEEIRISNDQRIQKVQNQQRTDDFIARLKFHKSLIQCAAQDYVYQCFLSEGKCGSLFVITKDSQYYAAKVFKQVYRDTFQHELDILNIVKKSSHRNLINLEEEGMFIRQSVITSFIIFPFYPITLKALLNLRWTKDISFIRKIFKGIVHGLHHLHTKLQIVHYDIKTSNILIDTDMHAIITDFGISQQIKPSQKRQLPYQLGTPLYMAPELHDSRIKGEGYCSKEADCWSLGILLYYLLYRVYPFNLRGYDYTQILISKDSQKLRDFFTIQSKKGQPGHIPCLLQQDSYFKQGINLMRQLLQVVPSSRLTIDQIIKHPFVSDVIYFSQSVASIQNKLQKLADQRYEVINKTKKLHEERVKEEEISVKQRIKDEQQQQDDEIKGGFYKYEDYEEEEDSQLDSDPPEEIQSDSDENEL